VTVYRREFIGSKLIICPIELKSWKIDYASHQYSDSLPISGPYMK